MIPVVMTVWRRANEAEQALVALAKSAQHVPIKLYVYSDHWGKAENEQEVLETRETIKKHLKNFPGSELIEADAHKKLGGAILNAMEDTFTRHDHLVQIEDDLVVSEAFLPFMKLALDKYRDEPKVGAISGYTHPPHTLKLPANYRYDTFFSRRPTSGLWATWKDRWQGVDWDVQDFQQFKADKNAQKEFNLGGDDLTEMLYAQQAGKINSWAVRWAYHCYKNGLLTLHPTISYSNNIGLDGNGVNSKTSDFDKFTNRVLNNNFNPSFPPKVEMDLEIQNAVHDVNRRNLKYYVSKSIYRIGKLFK